MLFLYYLPSPLNYLVGRCSVLDKHHVTILLCDPLRDLSILKVCTWRYFYYLSFKVSPWLQPHKWEIHSTFLASWLFWLISCLCCLIFSSLDTFKRKGVHRHSLGQSQSRSLKICFKYNKREHLKSQGIKMLDFITHLRSANYNPSIAQLRTHQMITRKSGQFPLCGWGPAALELALSYTGGRK